MSFPIIGTASVWENWANSGLGAWRMWFMAPYGSWIYAAFVRDNEVTYEKIDIGPVDPNYERYSWNFGLAANTPEDIFTHEQDEGGPDGAIGCGCIRGATPKLYLIGRSSAAPATNAVLHRFTVSTGFVQLAPGTIPFDGSSTSTPVNINHVAGLEVDAGNAYYLVLNNYDSQEFRLFRYAYTWDGVGHEPTHTVQLSTNYMENNTSAKIRGIATANDGNILLFVNTGITNSSCKVLKFDKDDLSYLGQTTWTPNISTATWGYITQVAEVFMLFQGLTSNSLYDWKTSIYYDRATGIPDADKSNFIISDNLTTFGDNDPITLQYQARDAFNIAVVGVSCKFAINGEDENDPTTWTDRLGAIRESTGVDFFDAEGVPEAISAIVTTNGSGVATAYYKPMRSGSGTEIDAIDVFCPSDN